MALEITQIQGNDTIAASRIVINNNFSVLASSITNLLTYLNTDSKVISGIEQLNITKGTTNITDVLLSTNGSGTFGGNISAAGSITGNNATIANGLKIEDGVVLLNSITSSLINKGKTSLDGEIIHTDLSTAALNAANELTFKNSQTSNNLIYDGNIAIAGKTSVAGRNTIVVDWSQFVDSNDAEFYLHRLQLNVTSTTPVGQRITIISKINEDLDLPQYGSEAAGYYILRNTLQYQTGTMNVGIRFTASYQTCELIYNGVNWTILNLYGATIQ